MRGFVIQFNRRTGNRRVTEFATPHEAMEYRLQMDAERVDEDIEIVALISESLETVRRTHSRYFTGQELPASR
ncbi:hypothetical protein CRI77_10295 [Mycolicibacterium duvalii]|uniref:Uncharacterized protein n=1 Tax=Mycolicibacterium duvalii TaxID=39688 RepID=A0A7I7K2J1_9MYCO|nr:hypothetical protein [Mycolicibacterium duvalii]MCV7366673.1 hypothetical protein [Mycolicibacterium duvalii]PEG41544.1 hypothetical protein CRI77_10295 [Mycolicibacterium duvalii]BBX17709.1 hypothetical protein MDUV_25690 [Mycolicibacterium duvalii]